MKRNPLSFTFGCVLLLVVSRLCAEPLKIELPPETSSFKTGPGVEIANAQCLVCHSVEYVATQPPFPRAFWASSIKKMREKYDAQIPEAQVEPLLDYLVERYGVGTNGGSSSATSVLATAPADSLVKDPKSPDALGLKYGCILCHGVDKKIVGPAFKDIAAKYRDDPARYAKIAEQVEKGGSGKWGPALMPPFPMVAKDEVKILSDWILLQK